jgi:hypothetical protein
MSLLEKYLRYKKKYLVFKNQIGLGIGDIVNLIDNNNIVFSPEKSILKLDDRNSSKIINTQIVELLEGQSFRISISESGSVYLTKSYIIMNDIAIKKQFTDSSYSKTTGRIYILSKMLNYMVDPEKILSVDTSTKLQIKNAYILSFYNTNIYIFINISGTIYLFVDPNKFIPNNQKCQKISKSSLILLNDSLQISNDQEELNKTIHDAVLLSIKKTMDRNRYKILSGIKRSNYDAVFDRLEKQLEKD